MKDYARLLTIVYPVVLSSDRGPGNGLALFDFGIVEEPQGIDSEPSHLVHVCECEEIKILPTEEEMNEGGKSFSDKINPDADSWYMRNRFPVRIRNAEDLAVLRETLFEEVSKLLQRSMTYQP